MRLSRSAAGNRWAGLRRAAGGAALPAAAWRRCGAQPVLWAPRAMPRGLRRQLFSTSVAEDMQVGAAGGVSPAAAEDSPAAEAAQEQVVSVDDEDEQLAAGGDDDDDDDEDDEAGDEVDDEAEESAGPRGPKTFEELMASVDQLREAGTPLEETTAAMLLAAVSAGGHRQILTDTHVKKAKKALELIEKEELSMSNRQLQKLLTKLRQKRVLKHTHGNGANAADLACTLTDAFFSSGTAVDVDSYNLLLQVVLRHDVAKCVKVAGTMSEFPGVYANQQTFGIVIEACTRTNRLEEAIGFVNQMRKMRYSPRPVLLIKLLELCALENNAEAARVCLDILDQQAQRRGLTLDDGSVIQLANLAARTGSIELLTDINSHFGSNSSGPEPAISKSGAFLNASLHCASSGAHLESCFATIEDMVSVGITADYATMMHAARSIAVDEETIDDAYYTVEARRTNGERVSIESLNLVILACAQLGCVDGRTQNQYTRARRTAA